MEYIPPMDDDSAENSHMELQETAVSIQYSLSDAVEHIGVGRYQIIFFFIVGLAWIADSMEMMVVSIVAPILLCEWNLPAYKEALITTTVFLGVAIGSPLWGYFSDIFGRKKALYASASMVLVFGIANSQSPSYYWMIALRFLVGCGIGGIPQVAVILTEVLPMKSRGKWVMFLMFFWAFGSVLAAAVAIGVIIQLNWHYYILIVTIPVLVFLLSGFWLPESPRFLLITGRHEQLVSLIERMCKSNGKPMLTGNLVNVEKEAERGRFTDMFHRRWRRTTALLFIIFFTIGFTYYGLILLTTEMLQTGIGACHPIKHQNVTNTLARCSRLTNSDYMDFMWTAVAEFPGVVIVLLFIDRLGRRMSLVLVFSLTAIAFLLLAICTNRVASIVFLFIARGLAGANYQAVYVYTAEVWPTNVRSVGMGTCSLFSRLGAMTTPFVAQMLILHSFYYVIVVYSILLVVCVVCSLLLHIETMGQPLTDSTKSNLLKTTGNDYKSFK